MVARARSRRALAPVSESDTAVIPSRADGEGPHNKTTGQRERETFHHSTAWISFDFSEIDLRL
jgi:hypothetical protein